ncbi:MAG: DMT family transporter [Syntrophobacteraceae bacterium]
MNTQTIKADILLLTTAILWGFGFVAQKAGMEHVGPFTYNGLRFALGSLCLLPVVLFTNGRKPAKSAATQKTEGRTLFWGGGLLGLILFSGVSLQQLGLMTTTAGKAGFITGLYVVMVPLLGLFWRQKVQLGTWIGAILAVAGLYLLSITREFTISTGDLLVLVGAVFWAMHVLFVGWLSPRVDALKLALFQYTACSLLSLLTALAIETFSLPAIIAATIPILYGGGVSVGIAYTLQVVAQRHAPAAHAAILLSLETAFAALGGWLLLQETLSARALLGCTLMLAGMLCSQLSTYIFRGRKARSVGAYAPTAACREPEASMSRSEN